MAKSNVKFLAFGCTHAPLHDPEHIEWIAAQIRQHKPDYLICLGDLFEADSASRWPSEYDWDLTDEYRAANDEVLKPLRKSAPKDVQCVLLRGNHCENLLAINRIPSKVRGMCDWRKKQYDGDGVWLNEELLSYWSHKTPYEYSKKGTYRIGQVTFAHGYECGQNADEMHTLLLGMPGGLYIGSHTHRPLPVTQAKRTQSVPLPYWYANSGCSRNMECEYMKRKRQHLWGQGCVIGDCDPIIIRGSIPTDKRWNAETLVRRMYE